MTDHWRSDLDALATEVLTSTERVDAAGRVERYVAQLERTLERVHDWLGLPGRMDPDDIVEATRSQRGRAA
jgi:hypothetical protein